MEIKKCNLCGNEKDIDSFAYSNKSKNIRHGRCKECKNKYTKKWYKKNKKIHKVNVYHNNKRYRVRNLKFIVEYLSTHFCVDCGERDFVVLDFDHVRGIKSHNISRMVTSSKSIKTIAKEIGKCEVRCANCHRRKTARDQNWYAELNRG